MMVLLLKQMHLQNDVAVDRAAQIGVDRYRRERRRRGVSGDPVRRILREGWSRQGRGLEEVATWIGLALGHESYITLKSTLLCT